MFSRLEAAATAVVAGLIVCALLSPSAALAGAVHEEFDFVQPPFFVACLGEEQEGVFRIRLVSHIRASANGGFHVTLNATQKGVVQGLSSGAIWTFKGASNLSFNTQANQAEFTAVAPLAGVSPGNPVVVATYRVVATFDANGVFKTFHFIDSIRCQGNPN